MTLDEAWDAEVTQAEARAEILKHHCSWQDFVNDVGLRETYEGSEVLSWLGY
jgi:hypothetical protein